MLRVLERQRVPVWTSSAVLGQVWRDGARQAWLAKVLAGIGVRALAADDGKRVGELQGAAGIHDVVDAHVALLAGAGDRVLTSDPQDLGRLLRARGVAADVVRI